MACRRRVSSSVNKYRVDVTNLNNKADIIQRPDDARLWNLKPGEEIWLNDTFIVRFYDFKSDRDNIEIFIQKQLLAVHLRDKTLCQGLITSEYSLDVLETADYMLVVYLPTTEVMAAVLIIREHKDIDEFSFSEDLLCARPLYCAASNLVFNLSFGLLLQAIFLKYVEHVKADVVYLRPASKTLILYYESVGFENTPYETEITTTELPQLPLDPLSTIDDEMTNDDDEKIDLDDDEEEEILMARWTHEHSASAVQATALERLQRNWLLINTRECKWSPLIQPVGVLQHILPSAAVLAAGIAFSLL